MAIVRMLHVALCVSDLDRSLAFYRDLLDFAVVGGADHGGDAARDTLGLTRDDAGFTSAVLGRDGVRLELVCFAGAPPIAEPRPADRVGLSHLAFAVDDLDSTVHSLRDRGLEVDAPPRRQAPGVASCLARDPDGNLIVLYQAPAGTSSPWDDG